MALAAVACRSVTPPPAPIVTAAAEQPWQGDPRQVLAAIERRMDGVATLAAECQLTFHRPDKDSVKLEGALVAQPPDRLRLRAWKLGHAVMDLTVRPDGVWLWTAKRASEGVEKLISGELSAGPWRTVWPRLGSLLGDADATIDATGQRAFTVRGRLADGGMLEAHVDGPSATVTAYRLFAADGEALGRLRLDEYQTIAGEPWPTSLQAEASRGTLEITLRDLTLDEALPATAFQPPKRATRRD